MNNDPKLDNSGARPTRRQFLKRGLAATAALGLPSIVPSTVFGANAPSNRIVMGCIGVGNQGFNNLKAFLQEDEVQIAAVCDVNRGSYGYATDAQYLGREPARQYVDEFYGQKRRSGKGKGCDAYSDFRELLAREDIDAVVNVTPDHWHALITVAAARAGKHIYGEKPLALTINEGKAMVEAVRRHGVTFQTGTHHRSNQQMRFALELVRNGRIGQLKRITIDLGPSHRPGPAGTWTPQPVPDGFDYDMWLGPAPWAPYHPDRCLYRFRFFMDYAGGNLTNNGTHMFDLAQWGNGTDHTGPVEMIYEGGTFPKDGLYDASSDLKFTARYANGVEIVCRTKPDVSVDMRFEGTKGWVSYNGSKVTIEPASLWRETIDPDELHLYRSLEHHRNFLECVRSGREPITPVETGHRSTTICHLGNICMQLGRNLQWDPEKQEFPGDEQANRMLSRPMRHPWHL